EVFYFSDDLHPMKRAHRSADFAATIVGSQCRFTHECGIVLREKSLTGTQELPVSLFKLSCAHVGGECRCRKRVGYEGIYALDLPSQRGVVSTLRSRRPNE